MHTQQPTRAAQTASQKKSKNHRDTAKKMMASAQELMSHQLR
jgi:hypothetical protein